MYDKYQQHLNKCDTNMRQSVPSPKHLAILLHWLGSAESYHEDAFAFDVGTFMKIKKPAATDVLGKDPNSYYCYKKFYAITIF